jgi:putative ABC transport system permease protein
MERVVADSLADMNLYLWLVGAFAALAVLLAICGVYAVVSFLVAARTQEFGLRMALGARGAQIVGLVLGRSAWLVACGLALGTIGSLATVRLLGSLLRGMQVADPLLLVTSAALLSAAALAACLVPAARAARVDPNTALRSL